MTHRTLAALILSILLAQAAFGGGRSRGSHPPTVSPEGLRPDFAAASVTGTVSAVTGNLISLAGGLITLDITGTIIEGDRSAGQSPRIVVGSRIIAITRTVDVPTGAPIPVHSLIVFQTADVTLSGTIQAIDVPGNTLTLLGRTIQAKATTTFGTNFPTFAAIVSVAGLAVGNVVSVQASVEENTLVALHVQVLTPTSAHPTVLRGTVKSIGGDSWVITSDRLSDVKVGVNAETKIVGPPLVGDRVEVIAREDVTGGLTALSIVRIEPPTSVTFLRGTVKSIGGDSWVIASDRGSDVKVGVNAETKIVGPPLVGDQVDVIAREDAAGGLTALSIVRINPPLTRFLGTVKAMSAAKWSILTAEGTDVSFVVNERTRIEGTFAMGDRVIVVASADSSGALTAVSITMLR